MRAQSAGAAPRRDPSFAARLPVKSLVWLAAALVAYSFAMPRLRAESKQPYEIVRSMQALQDQITLGNKAALAALPGLSAQLAEKLLAADPAVWREPRNARAAVTYVLSGGQPRVLHKILANDDVQGDDRTLMEGTLAYVEGKNAKAKELLSTVDPRALESIVGAHVAVAQAVLVTRLDPHKAIELLDMARILAPGTLVEEAALRREVFISEQIGDFDKFSSVAGQYLRRFSNSSYAENFLSRFSASIIAVARAGRLDQITKLESLLDEMNETARLRFYLVIAQSALVNGKLDTAQYAADKALKFAPQGSAEAQRAALYAGAVEALTKPDQDDLGKLATLDFSKLPRGDVNLGEAAIALSKEIHHWPEIRKAARDKEGPTVTPPTGSEPTIASADSAIDLAQKTLAATDEVQKEKSP